MILGFFHPGSGVGDQLFCYLAARNKARQLGVDFAMLGKRKADFIRMNVGKEIDIPYTVDNTGKIIQDTFPIFESKLKCYDPEYNFIEDNTAIDGCSLQDERYFDVSMVKNWLVTQILKMSKDLCVINFRGGEFALFPDLFLPIDYWNKAIDMMLEINPKMRFQVHTDDVATAQVFFPNYEIIHDVGLNWRSVRNAQYLILANSAFGIIPALIGHAKKIIAPRYWARHNTKEWSLPQNYYPRFTYI